MASKIFTKKRATAKKEPAIVELKNVQRTYPHPTQPVRALRGVNLSIDRSEMVAIMGPSGSGKTTLLNVIGLLDQPDEGKVVYAGQDLSEMKKRQIPNFRQKEVGLIFQQKNLIPTLTAYENVYLPFRYSRGKRGIKREQAREALRLVGLIERADHMPYQLSGGEQQRVAVARALVQSPSVILADEPTGELDTKTGDQIVQMMVDLNAQTGQTFIIVTHNEEVAKACDRTIRMRDGQVEKTSQRKRKR